MSPTIRDRLSGILFLSLGVFLKYAIPIYVPQTDDMVAKIGPRFFPNIISSGLIILSILLILDTFFNKKNENSDEKVKFIWSEEIKVIFLLFITIIYIAILEPVGFKVATPIATVSILAIFKVKKLYNYLIILSFVALVYFVFQELMYVQLP